MGSHRDHWCLWRYVCDVTLRPFRYTWPIGLFFQNALAEYIGVCTDTNDQQLSRLWSATLIEKMRLSFETFFLAILWENDTRSVAMYDGCQQLFLFALCFIKIMIPMPYLLFRLWEFGEDFPVPGHEALTALELTGGRVLVGDGNSDLLEERSERRQHRLVPVRLLTTVPARGK